MNIIGISAFFHDSACCLIQDGNLVAAVQEERFSRLKHDNRLPIRSFRYCLKEGGIDISDIDCIAYYESPQKKLSRQLWMQLPLSLDPGFSWLDPSKPEREIRQNLGFEGPIDFFEHHHTHAAGSFFYSGFQKAAILVADAVGEWTTTSYWNGNGKELIQMDEVLFPDSIGLFYSAVTQYLGFKVLSGEYKVMGLAPYGESIYTNKMQELIFLTSEGKFRLNKRYFDFSGNRKMYTEEFVQLMGKEPRKPESVITQFYMDIAKSLQVVLEEILVAQVKHLRKVTDAPDLCLSGGVALNCVANGRIMEHCDFDRLFVQPAAGDAGSALGAAALSHIKRSGERHSYHTLGHVYLGPSYGSVEVAEVLCATGLIYDDFRGDLDRLLDVAAEYLKQGKIIAWFQGRAEFGPRALGARSILADPRHPDMRNRLNELVKKREVFRPFGPAVLQEKARDHMDLKFDSPFMLTTCKVNSDIDLPAVTHVDGSCRPQTVSSEMNPKFARLLSVYFEKTGCPILVNTSFNIRSEPIVQSPADALRCLANSGIDVLIMEDFVIDRISNEKALNAAAELMTNSLIPKNNLVEMDNAYTFI